ncbi:hypothetical protein TPE_0204 [Treponema pedis str. T A4]|uniref:Uncharacterized protein n=1 Tax=Treponema pedis str. T A4 TaxID=1291379 RepID=S5ZRP2_9SPIR|nr:hypothetical protein TPE_0204 [Treponema pedis str. T A4]
MVILPFIIGLAYKVSLVSFDRKLIIGFLITFLGNVFIFMPATTFVLFMIKCFYV